MTGVLAAMAGGAVDRSPDAVNWANIGPGNSPQSNATQTMQGFGGTITIRATLSGVTPDTGAEGFSILRGGVSIDTETVIVNGASVECTVVSGDTINFQATKGSSTTIWTGTATVTVVETGETLDTFTISVTAP